MFCLRPRSPARCRVLPKHAFVEVLESRLSIDAVGDDPGPVIATAVTGGPLGKPLEFASGVASVVPAVATAAFSLVLEVSLKAVVKRTTWSASPASSSCAASPTSAVSAFSVVSSSRSVSLAMNRRTLSITVETKWIGVVELVGNDDPTLLESIGIGRFPEGYASAAGSPPSSA